MIPVATAKGPYIDWAALSPLVALIGGALVVLLIGLLAARSVRERGVPVLTIAALGTTLGMTIWQWHDRTSIISGALRVDDLALVLGLIFLTAALAAVVLSLGAASPEQSGHGEYHALLLTAAAGMLVLVEATNLVALFLGLELLSISLYVLCASELRREKSVRSDRPRCSMGSP